MWRGAGTWQLLVAVYLVIAPLSAHGRHSLARRHHHHNQSSGNKEALSTRMVLSDDSAERDHLIGAVLGAALPLGPTKRHHSRKHVHLDFFEEEPPAGEELTAGGAGPDQPGNPLSDDVVTVAFHSPAPDVVPSDSSLDWAKAPKAQKQKGGDPTAWTLTDFYDYLSPDNDLSASDTTPEPEPTPSPPADMEDENPLLSGSPALPDNAKPNVDSGVFLPVTPIPVPDRGDDLSLGGAMGADGCRLGFMRSGPGVCVSQCDVEPNFCFNGGVCTVVAGMGAFCRCNVQDYIWNKGTRCDWAITEFQVMCVVIGVASFVLLFLFMIVVCFAKRLHRLKNENKRLRKRSKYRPQSTEPQTDGLSVSTTADGSQPNVRKLCDTPPPAPQAHTHNLAYYDNIICQRPSTTSYTWEYRPRNAYNHFQDEPQKKDDPAKSPQPKEEGSMNILNSHSPKHENNRPSSVAQDHAPNSTEENAEDGVTIGLEVLLPKEAKLHSDTSAPLQYDVFLYKVANNGDSSSPSQAPPSLSANSYAPHHISKSPKMSKSPKSPKHFNEHPPINREPVSESHAPPGHQPSAAPQPSPVRHSAPGSCSISTCHHSPSRYKSAAKSSSSPPQLRRPRGRSQAPHSEYSESQSGHLRPSPSSPHLTQPPPSPSSRVTYSPVSTRSLPPLS